MPKVSVVIPCYNGEIFIADAIRSVLSQTHPDLECIVVDDCSTDDSVTVISNLARDDHRVHLVQLANNSGPSIARNTGIAAAHGEYIAFLDADDLFAPNRLETLLPAFLERSANAVIDNQSVVDFPDGKHVQRAFSFLPPGKTIGFEADDFFAEEARFGSYLSPGYMKPIFETQWLRETGLQFHPAIRVGEDFLFYAGLFQAGMRCVGVGVETYIYRRRKTSLSRSNANNLHAISDVCHNLLAASSNLSDVAVRNLRRKAALIRSFASLEELRIHTRKGQFLYAFRVLISAPSPVPALLVVARRRVVGR